VGHGGSLRGGGSRGRVRWRNPATVPDEQPPGMRQPLPRDPRWPAYDPQAPQTVQGLWSLDRVDGTATDIRSLDATAQALTTWPREDAPATAAQQETARTCLESLPYWTRRN
jgi:hypothetical protein